MKSLLIQILRLPFIRAGAFLKFRDTIMVNPAEHLWRTGRFIKDHLKVVPGETILDVGAADGGTSIWFATEFPQNKVIGFEPGREAWQLAHSRTGKFANIEIHNVALGEHPEEVTLHITSDPLAASVNQPDLSSISPEIMAKFNVTKTERCQQKKLDDLIGSSQRILLLKIDTQGSELRVLRGGLETLKRTRLVLIEMSNHTTYHDSARYFEVDEQLRKCGFELVDIYVTYRPKGILNEFDALYRNTIL